MRAETDVDADSPLEAAEKQASSTEQNQRHDNLRHHENITQTETAAGAGESILAFQRAGQNRTRSNPCRSEPKQQAGSDAENEGVQQDAPIETDGRVERDRGRNTKCGKCGGGPEGQQRAEESACE